MHAYAEVRPMIVNGTHSYASVDRIVALVSTPTLNIQVKGLISKAHYPRYMMGESSSPQAETHGLSCAARE